MSLGPLELRGRAQRLVHHRLLPEHHEARLIARQDELAGHLQRSAALHALASAWDGHRPRLQQAVQLANQLAKGREELPGLQQAARLAQEQLASARQQLDALQQRLGGHPAAEQLAERQRQLGEWRPRLSALEEAQRLWQRRAELASGLAKAQARTADLQARREQCVASGKATGGELQSAEQTLKITLELLERQRLARSASVEELRARLRDGEPCPVCGSAEHPYHHGEALLAALASQDEAEAARARQQVERLRDRQTELRTEYRELERQLGEAAEEQQRLAGELGTLDRDLASHAELLARSAEQRGEWLAGQLANLRQSIQQAERHQGELLALQQQGEQLQRQQLAAEQASQTTSRDLEHQNQRLGEDQLRLDAELQAFAGLLPGDWLQRWQAAPARILIELEAQVLQRRDELAQQADLVEEQRERQAALDKEQNEQSHRQQALQTCAARLGELDELRRAAEAGLHQCLGEQPSAAAWQQQLEQAQGRARSTATSAADALGEAQQRQVRLAAEEHNLLQRLQDLQQERLELERELAAWRAGHPQLDATTLAALLAQPASRASELRQRLQHASEALAQCQVRLEERSQQLTTHLARMDEAPEPTALEQALAEQQRHAEQAEHAASEWLAAVKEDDRRRQQSRELLARIAAAQAEHQRWGRIEALIGSATGDKFRKIAQAYNLDLLVQHANLQLRQLARRYRLQRGGSALGLLVLDTEMGDELRSVHSLSGGETFLVSLALALGLASMASSKLRIESLFIDEGFGSLDPESLQLAMDALDNLQAQGRKVAVISHVQEMHERIPVQIRVQRQGNGASALSIVG